MEQDRMLKMLLNKSKFTAEAFEKALRRQEEVNKLAQRIVDYFDDCNKAHVAWVEEEKRLTAQFDKEISAEPSRQKTVGFRTGLCAKLVAKSLGELFELNTKTSNQLKCEVLPRMEVLAMQLLMPCYNVYKRYCKEQSAIEEEARQLIRLVKQLSEQLKYYKSTFTDPLYSYNVVEQKKRLDCCSQTYGQLIRSERELRISIVKVNSLKQEFVSSFKATNSSMHENTFQMVEELSSLVRRRIRQFDQLIRQLEHDLRAAHVYVSEAAVQYFAISENGEAFLQECGFKQTEELSDQMLLRFAKFISRLFDSMKAVEFRHLGYCKDVAHNCVEFAKCVDRFRAQVIREAASLQKFSKKLAEFYGGKVYQSILSFNNLIVNAGRIFEKMSKGLGQKGVAVNEAVAQSTKNYQTLQKEIKRLYIDHCLVRKEYLRKKGLPAEPNPLVDRQPNKYEGFSGNISRLLKDSVSQNIIMITHIAREHNSRTAKAEAQLKKGLMEWAQQILDYTVLVRQNSVAILEELQTRFQTSNESRHEDINKMMGKDPLFTIVTDEDDLSKAEIEWQFPESVKEYEEIVKSLPKDQDQQSLQLERAEEEKVNVETTDDKIQHFDKAVNAEKDKEFLQKKIKFQLGEKYINSYSCAFSEKILLQGRLYITTRRLFFHSMFNSSNIFFGETLLDIHKKQILGLQKGSLFIFNNKIQFKTVKGNVTFSSFFKRDQTLGLIKKVFQLHDQPQTSPRPAAQQKHEETQMDAQEEQKAESQLIFEQGQELVRQRQKIISELYQQDRKTTKQVFSFLFKGIKIKFLLEQLYLRNNVQSNGLITNYHYKLRHQFKDFDVVSPPYSPAKPVCSEHKVLTRVATWKHLLGSGMVPFQPKFVVLEDRMQLFVLNNKKFAASSHVYSSAVPYSDVFWVRVIYEYNEVEEGVNCSVLYQVTFVKSTIMKGLISSKSLQETIEGGKNQTAHMLAFLNEVKKKKAEQKIPKIKQEAARQKQPAQEEHHSCIGMEQLRASEQQLRAKVSQLQGQLKTSTLRIKILLAVLVLAIGLVLI